MIRLTIVIPALGNVDSFESTILSVLENRPTECEILVPQCGDYPDPYNLSDEVKFLNHPSATSGAELIAHACASAQGEIVNLLAAGTTVSAGWTEAPLARFCDPLTGSVVPLLLQTHRDRLAAIGISYRAGGSRRVLASGKPYRPTSIPKVRPLGPTSTAGFYRREALEEAGGWPTCVGDQLADVDLALSLFALGWTCSVETASTIHCDAPLPLPERTFEAAGHAERLFWRHASSVGYLRSLLLHPLTIALESLRALPNVAAFTCLAARLLALGELPRHLRHQQLLLQDDLPSADIVPLSRAPGSVTAPEGPPLKKAS